MLETGFFFYSYENRFYLQQIYFFICSTFGQKLFSTHYLISLKDWTWALNWRHHDVKTLLSSQVYISHVRSECFLLFMFALKISKGAFGCFTSPSVRGNVAGSKTKWRHKHVLRRETQEGRHRGEFKSEKFCFHHRICCEPQRCEWTSWFVVDFWNKLDWINCDWTQNNPNNLVSIQPEEQLIYVTHVSNTYKSIRNVLKSGIVWNHLYVCFKIEHNSLKTYRCQL